MATEGIRIRVGRNGFISNELKADTGKTLIDKCRFIRKEMFINILYEGAIFLFIGITRFNGGIELFMDFCFNIKVTMRANSLA